jgi:peptidoglycan/xylan/chitin deacetylase (PgdA/CDA1 family)
MTPSYLALLKKLDVRATFFVIGDNARKHPELIRAYVEHGHEVLSHGMTHTPFPRLSHGALLAERRETQALLPPPSRVPTLFRPPQGAKTLKSLYQVAAAGFTSALWSLDSDDCRTTDPAEVSNRVVTMARGGDVILLHEFQQWTLDALTSAVAGLRMRSLVPVTMSELLRSEP